MILTRDTNNTRRLFPSVILFTAFMLRIYQLDATALLIASPPNSSNLQSRSCIASHGMLQNLSSLEPGVRLTRYKVIGATPAKFREFDFFILNEKSTDAHGEITRESNGDVPIIGNLYTTGETFKIVSGRLIAGKDDYESVIFTTEERQGISYTFNGRFLKRPKQKGVQFVDLKGTLTKLRSSRRIATAALDFYVATRS